MRSTVRLVANGWPGCLISVLSLTACESSETPTNTIMDASTACESPLNPVALGSHAARNGCGCANGWSQPDYCINGWGALCYSGTDYQWWFAADGRCFPFRDQGELEDSCRARRGVLVGRDLGRACPTGFGTLTSSFEAAADGGTRQSCCHPIDVLAPVCAGEGLQVVAAGAQTSLLDTRCSNGGELRGFVIHDAGAPSLCCTAGP